MFPRIQQESVKLGFSCGKSKYQVCKFMSVGDVSGSHVTGKYFGIGFRFHCDSSGSVY